MPIEDFIRRLITHEKKEKIVKNPGVIGHYDSKPYHNFHYALIYAEQIPVIEGEDLEVFSRVYKNVTFVNILVNKDIEINLDEYKYEVLKPLLIDKGVKATDKSCVLMLFQHYTQNAVNLCCKFSNSNKNHFEQGLIYNAKYVQMDFYRPVPKYMVKMYTRFCENLYFDLAFIDPDRG